MLEFVHVSQVREQAEQVEFTPLSKYPFGQVQVFPDRALFFEASHEMQLFEALQVKH